MCLTALRSPAHIQLLAILWLQHSTSKRYTNFNLPTSLLPGRNPIYSRMFEFTMLCHAESQRPIDSAISQPDPNSALYCSIGHISCSLILAGR